MPNSTFLQSVRFKKTYPIIADMQQSTHIDWPTVRWVCVTMTSWQDGHWVTAGVRPRLLTSPQERKKERKNYRPRHSDVGCHCYMCVHVCEVVLVTWNGSVCWCFFLRPSFFSLLQCNVLCKLGRRQQVDPPTGYLRFIRSGTHILLTWFKTCAV